MTYSVRDARPAEMDAIVAIGKAVHPESTYAHLAFDAEKTAHLVIGAILRQPGWYLRLVTFDDIPVGGIIGWCGAEMFSQDKIARDITFMLLPEHRGKCVLQIKQCIEDYKTWAIAVEQAKLVFIGSSSGFSPAGFSRVFAGLGFKITGVLHSIRVGV